jgi:uncharacterized protein
VRPPRRSVQIRLCPIHRREPSRRFIFGANAARLYRINLKAADNTTLPAYSEDRLAKLKSEYELAAKEPSNLRYGYVRAA